MTDTPTEYQIKYSKFSVPCEIYRVNPHCTPCGRPTLPAFDAHLTRLCLRGGQIKNSIPAALCNNYFSDIAIRSRKSKKYVKESAHGCCAVRAGAGAE